MKQLRWLWVVWSYRKASGFRLQQEGEEMWATTEAPSDEQISSLTEALSLLKRKHQGNSPLVNPVAPENRVQQKKVVDRQVEAIDVSVDREGDGLRVCFSSKPQSALALLLLTGSRLISLPLTTQMFQFAKFENSKERSLATELGYDFRSEIHGSETVSPHGLSPLKASFLLNAGHPSNA
ncbi:hypothetical protein H6P81_016402 [Aristolochia fimbriata]|uniref:Uncharacterized protein n=1 Tax=Aristolochia fimbriata TaxID=158543 RepID=A0AAV7EC08_ARIFI|nr:hypothetical protein H6P81_016402 [Aristolochia fimbriata]